MNSGRVRTAFSAINNIEAFLLDLQNRYNIDLISAIEVQIESKLERAKILDELRQKKITWLTLFEENEGNNEFKYKMFEEELFIDRHF